MKYILFNLAEINAARLGNRTFENEKKQVDSLEEQLKQISAKIDKMEEVYDWQLPKAQRKPYRRNLKRLKIRRDMIKMKIAKQKIKLYEKQLDFARSQYRASNLGIGFNGEDKEFDVNQFGKTKTLKFPDGEKIPFRWRQYKSLKKMAEANKKKIENIEKHIKNQKEDLKELKERIAKKQKSLR